MEKVPALADQPVIFISAYDRVETIAKTLEAGVADYLVRPFSSTEPVARIRSALRMRDDPEHFVLGDPKTDYDRRSVSLAGVKVDLTNTEYELLRTLSLRVGRVLTFDFLIRRVWRQRVYANPKLVHVFIKKQRGKLNDDAKKPSTSLANAVSARLPHGPAGRVSRIRSFSTLKSMRSFRSVPTLRLA